MEQCMMCHELVRCHLLCKMELRCCPFTNVRKRVCEECIDQLRATRKYEIERLPLQDLWHKINCSEKTTDALVQIEDACKFCISTSCHPISIRCCERKNCHKTLLWLCIHCERTMRTNFQLNPKGFKDFPAWLYHVHFCDESNDLKPSYSRKPSFCLVGVL